MMLMPSLNIINFASSFNSRRQRPSHVSKGYTMFAQSLEYGSKETILNYYETVTLFKVKKFNTNSIDTPTIIIQLDNYNRDMTK